MADVGMYTELLERFMYITGQVLAVAWLARSVLQALEALCDKLDDWFPRLRAVTTSIAWACGELDGVIRIIGAKSLQGQKEATRAVLRRGYWV